MAYVQVVWQTTDGQGTEGYLYARFNTVNNMFYNPVNTASGILEVAIASPIFPFGAVHTESAEPIFQVDAVYGINNYEISQFTLGSGTVTAANNLIQCSSGGTGTAAIKSKRAVNYKPGQGVVGRFTALFPQQWYLLTFH